jgi:proteasome lid subunit RPN8/RPN11
VAARDGEVANVYRTRNAAPNPVVTYLMEPHDQLRIFKEIDDRGLSLLAIYHSHPASPAYPSPTDLAQAFYPDAHYLIVSLAEPSRPVVRAFRLDQEQGQAHEVKLVITN